ncbi:MAG: signal recognition particle-docking protein FtsY, partial [Nitrosopumilus sp.]
PEPKPEPEPDDPFEGITDDEIATYSDLFDIPPPETDEAAINLGNKIRKWIKDGKPNPNELKIDDENNEKIDDQKLESLDDDKNDAQKPDTEKPKKKRGLFGFFRK